MAKLPHQKKTLPKDLKEAQEIARHALLTTFLYMRNAEELPEGWEPSDSMADELFENIRNKLESFKGIRNERAKGFKNPKGVINFQQGGLSMAVLRNDENKQVALVFGGSSVTASVSKSAIVRSVTHPRTTFAQWVGSNIGSTVLGKVPKSNKIVEVAVEEMVEMALNKEVQLTVYGHSKGGGEAITGIVAQLQDVNGVVFSPLWPGRGLTKHIRNTGNETNAEKIQEYHVSGDPVSHRLWPGATKVGIEYSSIPPKSRIDSPHTRHMNFAGASVAYAKSLEKEQKRQQETPTDAEQSRSSE